MQSVVSSILALRWYAVLKNCARSERLQNGKSQLWQDKGVFFLFHFMFDVTSTFS